jgi:creatinine amidohydrolase
VTRSPTEIIHYGDLTWPEVAALPRDLPLVLPLGPALDPTELARQLGVDRLCLLPAVPYGWPGSLVPLEPELFRRAIQGISSAPLEEGFRRLIVAAPAGVELSGIAAEVLAAGGGQRTASADGEVAPRDRAPASGDRPTPLKLSPQRVVLVPFGHTEQHGYHLPMSTDTIIIQAVAGGTAEAAPGRAEALPAFPYGASTHRSQFAGTFNMGGRTFEDFALGVVHTLVRAGADRLYLLSGHGGNMSFLVNAVKYAGEQLPDAFTATAFLHTSGRIGAQALEQHRRSARGGMGHAGELETSMLLRLRPDLCHMDRVVDETDFTATPNYYMDWVEGGELIANPPWTDDTQTGAYGAGSLATAENGARWLQAAIQEKLSHIEEIHEQQDRRLARRTARQPPA